MAHERHGHLVPGVRGYAASVMGWSEEHIVSVRPFEGGNRHAVFQVKIEPATPGPVDLVVRVSLTSDAAERAAADREARVLRSTGGHAAPVLYDYRASSQWLTAPAMCLQCLSGDEMDLASASAHELEQLGSVVAWIHARPAEAVFDESFATDDIATYARRRLRSITATIASVRDPLPATLQRDLRRTAASVLSALEARCDGPTFRTGERLALLHGDIGPGNVLATPDPVLIDWEYARLGDPADEIAYTFDQNSLTAPQREAFWRGYASSVTDEAGLSATVERARWWEPLTLLGSTLWWTERWARRTEAETGGTNDPSVPREATYYRAHVERRLARLRRHSEAP